MDRQTIRLARRVFCGFDEGDGRAGGFQGDSGSHSRQTASDHDHAQRHRDYLDRVARQAMRNLVMGDSFTRSRNTRPGSANIFSSRP